MTWKDEFCRGGLSALALFGLLLGGCDVVKRPDRGAAGPAVAREVITTKTGVEMVLVPAGEFRMGDDLGEDDEKPVHRVEISAFYMDTCEVTQEGYQGLMGGNPSKFAGPGRPVERLSWYSATQYCNMRSLREGLRPCYDPNTLQCDFTADGYRLPTEAEWEYACRAGTAARRSFGSDPGKLGQHAWFQGNAHKTTHRVRQKSPNPWGLYDMYGNVSEWCHDVYSESYDSSDAAKDPRGGAAGEERVLRGGSWADSAESCRSSVRNSETPRFADACFGTEQYGFRCVRNAQSAAAVTRSEPPASPPESPATPPEPPSLPPRPPAAPPEPAFTEEMTVEALRKEAVDVARQLMEAYPHRAGPIGLMGMVHNRQGNTAAAVKCWQKCLDLDPRRADAYKSMGEVAARKGEDEKAVALFRKALQIHPTAPDVHDALGRTLMKLVETQQAIAVLEKGAAIFPKASRSHHALARAYLQAKEYRKAKKSYQAAIAIRGDLTNAYYGLATACARLALTDQARKHRQKFQELKAADRKARKDQRDALLDEVRREREHVAGSHTDAGHVYLGYGDAGKAQRLWLRAATLDPKNTACRGALATLYQRANRPTAALEICRQIEAVEPENPINYLRIGFLCRQLQRPDAAEEAFRKVLQLAPQRPEGYAALAQLYLQTDRQLAEAKTLAARAVELQPSAANYGTLAEACQKNGDLRGGLSALQRALQLDPDNAKYRRMHQRITTRK